MRAMKEKELREAATCGKCGEKIGASRLPLFWRVRVTRFGIKMDTVNRQAGLEMMMGGVVELAQALSPEEDMAVEIMDPIEITVCEACSMLPLDPVAVLAERHD